MRENAERIRIAGGGPAGLACAIALARAGRPVVVFESRPAPTATSTGRRELFENWTDDAEALGLLEELGLELGEPALPLFEAEVFDDGLRATRVSSARPFAYLLLRGDAPGSLDAALAARAAALGVDLRYGQEGVPFDADVVATGASDRALVWKEIVFPTDSPECIRFLVDPVRAPAGYAWLAIRGSIGSLGCLVGRDVAHVERAFEACLQRFRKISDFSVDGGAVHSGGLDCLVADSGKSGGSLVIGAAAGSRDLLFGLGLRGALDDGLMAAKSLLEGKSFDALREEHAAPAARASLAQRYRFERWSDTGLRRRVARCGRGDFRESLRRCARPSFTKEVVALAARSAWRRPQSCEHAPRDHWCREVESPAR